MFLTWLADALREAGLNVVEFEGWQTRSKASEGYKNGRPWGVMWHHSASPPSTSAEDLAHYCCYGADAAPICNVNVERDGTIWVLAAGPTNTNGKGNAYGWSKGTVPADSMNSYAFGMELSNGGTGEHYPQVQIDAAFAVSNVVNRHAGNSAEDIGTHFDYAPDRKIDPAKAVAVEGPWRPDTVGNSADTWDVISVAQECARRSYETPQPEPGTEDMPVFAIARPRGFWDTGIIGPVPEGQSRHLSDPAKAQLLVDSFLVMDLQGRIVPAGTDYNSVTRIIEDVGLFTTLTGITPSTPSGE